MYLSNIPKKRRSERTILFIGYDGINLENNLENALER